MAYHSVVSWNPLAEWLQAVDKLRRGDLGSLSGALRPLLWWGLVDRGMGILSFEVPAGPEWNPQKLEGRTHTCAQEQQAITAIP